MLLIKEHKFHSFCEQLKYITYAFPQSDLPENAAIRSLSEKLSVTELGMGTVSRWEMNWIRMSRTFDSPLPSRYHQSHCLGLELHILFYPKNDKSKDLLNLVLLHLSTGRQRFR